MLDFADRATQRGSHEMGYTELPSLPQSQRDGPIPHV